MHLLNRAPCQGTSLLAGSSPSTSLPCCSSRLPLRHAAPAVASPSCSPSVLAHEGRPTSIVARAGKLDDVPLFGPSTSGLTGKPAGSQQGQQQQKGPANLDEIPLASEVSMDYTALRDYLKNGEWRKAEDETRALLVRLAGEDAMKRGWVYFTEVKGISVTDFRTIDTLWRVASNNKFGYSVQKEIFSQCQKRWPKFFQRIAWVQGENNNYRKWPMEFIYSLDAPRGHLPLTNALRGTQLFQAILEHPAWDKPAKKSIDDIAKEQAQNTLKF